MKTILIIEDDIATQKAYSEKLTKVGYQLYITPTASEAFTILMRKGSIDGIILDVMLPGGKNGFDILEELQANPQWKSIPVLMLTNLDSEETVAHTMGIADYLVKSNTSIDEVVFHVKRLVGV